MVKYVIRHIFSPVIQHHKSNACMYCLLLQQLVLLCMINLKQLIQSLCLYHQHNCELFWIKFRAVRRKIDQLTFIMFIREKSFLAKQTFIWLRCFDIWTFGSIATPTGVLWWFCKYFFITIKHYCCYSVMSPSSSTFLNAVLSGVLIKPSLNKAIGYRSWNIFLLYPPFSLWQPAM